MQQAIAPARMDKRSQGNLVRANLFGIIYLFLQFLQASGG
jgi:hypothetical protein